MKIPITMCHGVERKPSEKCPLTAEHFEQLMKIVHEMGFQSINYDQLAAWRNGSGKLPPRPIMFDFDHPVASMRCEVFEVLSRYGFKANLFVNTGMMEQLYSAPLPPKDQREIMTWEELG